MLKQPNNEKHNSQHPKPIIPVIETVHEIELFV